MRINELPHWVFTDLQPAFNDTESLTAVEMVSRIYGKVQELIDEYNKCVDEINKAITDFIESAEQDAECFKARINKIMHDYIALIDEKIKLQDEEIKAVHEYLTLNLATAISDKVQEMIDSGLMNEVVINGINDLKNRLPIVETRITNLETRLSTDEESINANNTNISNIDSRLSTTETSITSLDARITDGESATQALDSRITTAEEQLEAVQNGLPNYVLKENIAIVTGELTFNNGLAIGEVAYPEGFTLENSIVISFMSRNTSAGDNGYGYGYLETATAFMGGAIGHMIHLRPNDILLHINNPTDGSHDAGTATFTYKIVLMKI